LHQPRTHDLAETIDAAAFSALQARIVLLCVLIGVLDGFDIQAIAVVAPMLAAEWRVPVASFGPVFAAGLVGLAVGALGLGPAGDRFGRKYTVLLCTFIIGLFSMLTATAGDVRELILFRFLTGIGLGGAMPNLIALTAEYSPKRLRATVITIMFCGLPIGLMLGGLVGASLIPAFGWRSLFVAGGVAPFLILPVLARWLPESIRFLVAAGRRPAEVMRLMRRIAPTARFADDDRFVIEEAPLKGAPVRLLFANGRGFDTALLWLCFFMNLLVMYFFVNWMPVLFTQIGLPQGTAIRSLAAFNLGGIIGAIILGRLLDRANPYPILAAAYAIAAIGIGVVASLSNTIALLMSAIFVIGFGVMGTQIGMNAITATIYPVSIRATGIGWALGIGRLGSIVGPTVAGLLLQAGWTATNIFLLAAAPATIAAIALLALGARRR
jgi:AAHS family 4-hydroxybenzoate transporter-like MFS transporter